MGNIVNKMFESIDLEKLAVATERILKVYIEGGAMTGMHVTLRDALDGQFANHQISVGFEMTRWWPEESEAVKVCKISESSRNSLTICIGVQCGRLGEDHILVMFNAKDPITGET